MTVITVVVCLVLAMRILGRRRGAPRSSARELYQRRLRTGSEG